MADTEHEPCDECGDCVNCTPGHLCEICGKCYTFCDHLNDDEEPDDEEDD